MPEQSERKSREQWFQQLVSSVGGDLLRFLRSRLDHGDLAQDLAQEVYLRLLRMDDVRLIRDPRSFVIHLAANAAYEWRMLARNRAQHSEDGLPLLIAEHGDPAEIAENQDHLENLFRVFGMLSAKRQAVVVLHRRDGLTYQQIAERMNLSVGMVKKHLARGLAECHAQVAEMEQPSNGR